MKITKISAMALILIFIFSSCKKVINSDNINNSEEATSYQYDYEQPLTSYTYPEVTPSYAVSSETSNNNYSATQSTTYNITEKHTVTSDKASASTTIKSTTLKATNSDTATKPTTTKTTTAKSTTVKPITTAKNTTTTAKPSTTTKKTTTTTKPTTTTTKPTTSTTKPTTTTTKHTHNYTSSVTREPTCINQGVKTYRCTSCNHSYTEAVAALGHSYSSEIANPTCTEKGYTIYKCSKCSHSYKDNITSALGHTYQITQVVEPTKETDGYTVYTCSVCSHSYKSDKTQYVPSEQEVYDAILAMKPLYPTGTPWTNENYYDWNGGIYNRGYGCAGFAFMMSDAAFGNLPARKSTDMSKLRTGDVLRINNDGHSVIVLKVESDGVIVAEGSLNNAVYWGRKLPLSTVNAPNTFYLTRYPE